MAALYAVGCFVDAKDTSGGWLVAKVIETMPELVSVRYDGWSEKWNAVLPISSSKLAPFRKHTKNYTGQAKQAIRDWIFRAEEIEQAVAKLRRLTAGETLDAFEITQFLRGHVFTLVDCLLVNKAREVELSYRLFTAVIDFTVSWLKRADSLLPVFYASSDLYLTDSTVALACVWPELIFTLARLFGRDRRTSYFHSTQTAIPRDYESVPVTKAPNNPTTFHLNYFAKVGGFQALIKLLKDQQTDSRVPIEFLALLDLPSRYMSKPLAADLYDALMLSVSTRLATLTAKDINDMDREQASKMFCNVAKLIEHSTISPQKFIEEAELTLSLKFFQSPYLEKRIRGLNDIKDTAKLASHKAQHSKAGALAAWVVEARLIDAIFGENPHIELVKRACDLLSLLAQHSLLTVNHLDMIWGCSQAKHESFVRTIYQVILELVPKLTLQQCRHMFNLIKSVPSTCYDEKYLKFVKDFSVLAIEVQSTVSSASSPEDFGASLLFEALKDTSPLSVIELARDCLEELLTKPACRSLLQWYAYLCLENIKGGHSVPQSYKLLITMLNSLPQGEFLAQLATNCSSPVKMCIDDLQSYFQAARTAAEGPYTVLHGKHSHKQQITVRLKFLECLIKDHVKFTLEDFRAVWQLFVPTDLKCLVNWLYKGRGLLYSNELLAEVFQEFFVAEHSLPSASMSLVELKCFESHFLAVNRNAHRLELKGNSLSKRVHSQLIGYSKLLHIAISAQDNDVSKHAILLIVKLHRRLDAGLGTRAVWSKLIEDCLDLLSKDSLTVTRTLKLMLRLIDEDTDSLPPTMSLLVINSADFSPIADHAKLPINLQETIGVLRKKLAVQYKKPVHSIEVNINGVKYDATDDDQVLSSLPSFDNCFVEFDPEASLSPECLGVHLLAESQPLMDILFELLSRPNQSYIEEAWSLLAQLPMSPRIKSAIQSFELSVEEMLDNSSVHHLLYCLLIISELLNSQEWLRQFVERAGVPQLVRVYLQTDHAIGSSVALKYYATVMQLLAQVPCPEVAKTINKTLDVLQTVMAHPTQLIAEADTVVSSCGLLLLSSDKTTLLEFPGWMRIIEDGLIHNSSSRLSFALADLVLSLCTQEEGLNSFFLSMLLSKLDRSLNSKHTEAYLHLTAQLSQTTVRKIPQLALSIDLLTRFIRLHLGEKSAKEADHTMKGAFELLTALLPYRPDVADKRLLDLVLHMLFVERASEESSVLQSSLESPAVIPKCQSPETRKSGFGLLLQCCAVSAQLLEETLKYLQKFIQDPSFRTSRLADWHYAPSTLVKSATGFVGLKNLGATCYMGATLQQLFMIPSFRKGVLSMASRDSENLMHQLKHIFTGLELSQKQSISPRGFTKAYKDWEGNPIDPAEQMDAYEFLITFLDKVEGCLKGTSQHQLVHDHFGGVLSTENIGRDSCSHSSERNEPYMALNVEVTNKRTLLQSLESFVDGEVLEGDNAYQCERCEGKVSALRRVCIKQLPNVLIVALRRFAFDFDSMARLKVNDYCEFPLDLDMEPYTQEGLRRRDLAKRGHVEAMKLPKEYYQYQLKGIVVHMGTADSGHYYSFIQDRNSRDWIEFNDSLVKGFNPDDIPSEAFGGQERWPSNAATPMKEKFRNAYMLVYERQVFFSAPDNEGSVHLIAKQTTEQTDTSLSVKVRKSNERLLRCLDIFSPEYLEFVHQLLYLEHSAVPKFILSFLLTTLFRTKDKPNLIHFIAKAKSWLKKDQALSLWLLEVITCDPVLKELLLDCPAGEMRVLSVSLASFAANQVAVPQVKAALKRLVNNLSLARAPQSINFSHFFLLLSKLSKQTPHHDLRLFSRLLKHVQGSTLHTPKFEVPTVNADIYLGYDKYKAPQPRQELFSMYEGSSLTYCIELLYELLPSAEPEALMLLRNYDVIAKLSYSASSKRGAKSLGQIFHYLSTDRADEALGLISLSLQGVAEFEAEHAEMFLRQLKPLLMLECSSYPQRLRLLMAEFVRTAETKVKHYKSKVECINWLLKISALCPSVTAWVRQHADRLKFFETLLASSLHPPPTEGRKAEMQSIVKSNSAKLKAIKRLLKGTETDEVGWDSDDDLSSKQFQIGDQLQAVDPSGYRSGTATVMEVTDELLLLRFDQWGEHQTKWVDRSSEALRPLRSS
jgi:ubiquitin carboxyl-terminal hydrolase 9/24